jgi:hypothetical protein
MGQTRSCERSQAKSITRFTRSHVGSTGRRTLGCHAESPQDAERDPAASNSTSRSRHANSARVSSRERNRYFTGKLLDEDDLTQEQHYFLEKARRHNRMLHGWGIVSGLRVRPGATSSELILEPGYALDPLGNEIVVEDEVTVDLRSEDDDGNAVSPCPRTDDDRRKRVHRERSPNRPLYLAIAFAECMTRPLPRGESTEYSRIRDSFAIRVLTALPDSDRQEPPLGEPGPDVDARPWVILAEFELGSNREVSNVDHRPARRASGTL